MVSTYVASLVDIYVCTVPFNYTAYIFCGLFGGDFNWVFSISKFIKISKVNVCNLLNHTYILQAWLFPCSTQNPQFKKCNKC